MLVLLPEAKPGGMHSDESNGTEQLAGTDIKKTAVFVVLDVVLRYRSRVVTESQPVRLALLLGVGVIAPTVVNGLRERPGTEEH